MAFRRIFKPHRSQQFLAFFGPRANGDLLIEDTGVGDEAVDVGELLVDNELANMLKQFHGFRTTVFLDACHGGGFWGGSDLQEATPGHTFTVAKRLRQEFQHASSPGYGWRCNGWAGRSTGGQSSVSGRPTRWAGPSILSIGHPRSIDRSSLTFCRVQVGISANLRG